MDDTAIREALIGQFRDGRDLDRTHEIYHEEAILEFPQSGERFVGKASFLTWRKAYPSPVSYRIRRISGSGERWFVELLVSYAGGPPMFGVGMFEFRGDRIARETIYVAEGFEPAGFRAAWVTPFDRLASISPDDWVDGAELAIDAAAVGR